MLGFVERRKFRRIPVEACASVEWKGRTVDGTVRDISLLGILLTTGEEMSTGDTVKVTLHLESTSSLPVIVQGVVVRIDDLGYGIRFTEIDLVSLLNLKNIFAFNSIAVDNLMDEYFRTVVVKPSSESSALPHSSAFSGASTP